WVPTPSNADALEFADADEAMAWLTAEQSCLQAAQSWAAQHAAHSAVWYLAWALDTFYWRRGLADLHLASWRLAIAAAQHLDDTALAQAHRSLSHALMRAGDHTGALTQLRAALAVYSRMGAVLEQGHVNHDLAAGLAHLGNVTEAITYAERALQQ